ncbi:MAG: GTP-binding protein [Candidatus Thermoplasmatota archaeon]|nr:GTP-binding protein [Candidatus Thermoplasmatota archaeon]MBU4070755.1 GTP-binding protein [Candidatus Thermoplasmatota archaeon]MBU4144761.1 GTP-binding protein [Candidatus Thermoplasmatota archaeon]MBU4591012.1 GTP-binding protein [Candidatus Thermoplasmatota archaeon]
MEKYSKNIVLLGDSAVGKTSLIQKYVVDQFDDKYISTIGKKVTKKKLMLETPDGQVEMKLMIWDIIGQKGYRYSQATSFYNAKGAIMVSDLTKKETLDSVMGYWIPLVLRVLGPIPIIFLGNKADLEDERQYGLAEVEKVAESCEAFGYGRYAYLSSAKTGENIDIAFKKLGEILLEKYVPIKLGSVLQLMDKDEISTVKDALDHIMADFADQFGKMEYATPFLQHQLKISQVNLNNPTRSSVELFVNNLAIAEGLYKEAFRSDENRRKRLDILRYAKD